MEKLGYRVQDSAIDRTPLYRNRIDQIIEQLNGYDACQDCPWNLLYKELYMEFPNGKFILTLRDENDWLKSIVNHFGTTHSDLREHAYGKGAGFPAGNEVIYLERFRKHNQDVIEFFKDKQDQLLVLNVAEEDAYQKLCLFLGKPVIREAFPKKNVRSYSLFNRVLMKATRLYQRIRKRLSA